MGDYVRWAPPYYGGEEQQELGTRSALYLSLNRGKRSIRLDLKTEQGREALLRLVKDYDVVLDGFRPGVLDRLGVGYEQMREANPAIVFCAITGYGQDGPYTERAGHDMNYLGLVGLLGLTGAKGGPPVQSGGQIADLGGGALMAAFGVMAALHESRRSGEGQMVDVSMADGALSWLAMVAGRYFCDGEVPRRGEQQLAGGLICYMPYEAKRRLGHLRRPRAEVLGRALQRGRPGRPDRVPVRRPRLRCLAGDGRGLPLPHPRGVAGLQRRARLLRRAGPRHRRGPRLGAGPRARDGGRDGAARARDDPPARVPGEDEPHPRRPDPSGAGLRRAHPRGPRRGRATPRTRSRRCSSPAPRPGRAPTPRRPSGHERERRAVAASHRRAGRGLGGPGADDQALPARGPAPRAGEDEPQHGLLPAGVRRPDQADQAAAGGALHAAEGDQVGPRRRPRAGPGLGRARGPDPRARARRRARADQRRRGSRELRGAEGGPRPARGARGPEPEQPRLLALRHPDHRGDQPLSHRWLRRGDRVHGLRHPPLQAGDGGAGPGRDRDGDGAPRGRGAAGEGRRDARSRIASRCRT